MQGEFTSADLPSWQSLVDPEFERALAHAQGRTGPEVLTALDRIRAVIPFPTPMNGNEQGEPRPMSPSEARIAFAEHIRPIMVRELHTLDADDREDLVFRAHQNFQSATSILATEAETRMAVDHEGKGWPDVPDSSFADVERAIQAIHDRLEEGRVQGKVTHGDKTLSRGAHVERAVSELNRIRRLIGLYRLPFGDSATPSADHDFRRHLASTVSETFFAAFNAGQHAQLAIGKDNEAAFVKLQSENQKRRKSARKAGDTQSSKAFNRKAILFTLLDKLGDKFWRASEAERIRLARRSAEKYDEEHTDDPLFQQKNRYSEMKGLSDDWYRRAISDYGRLNPAR